MTMLNTYLALSAIALLFAAFHWNNGGMINKIIRIVLVLLGVAGAFIFLTVVGIDLGLE